MKGKLKTAKMKGKLKTALVLIPLLVLSFVIGRFSATYEINITKRSVVTQTTAKEFPRKAGVETPPPVVPGAGAKVDVEFTDSDSPYQGEENAPILLVEFLDLQCSFCKNSQKVINRIMSEYNGKVKLVFKNDPLPFHQDAMLAHQAAMAAHEQGKFWEMINKIFNNQQNITEEDLRRYAQDIGLDMKRFERDWKSEKVNQIISRDIAEGAKAGVTGTPTFFINGRMLVGAAPFENFRVIIEEELEKK